MTAAIELDDLALESKRRQIGPFILAVESGETVALVGPNGSGKTSCLRLALGLDRADVGTSTIHGKRVTPTRPPTGVGVVLEADGCYPWLTGRENVSLFATLLGEPPDRVDVGLATVGLEPAADQSVRTYSRGMRQRLSFARAALGAPTLFVLDEPTVALDGDASDWLVLALRAHAEAGGSTLLASHDRPFLADLGAREVGVDQGRCG